MWWLNIPARSAAVLQELFGLVLPGVRGHRRSEPDHVAVRIDEHTLMSAPLGVLRWAHIPSGCEPGRGQRVGILNEQVSGRSPVHSRIEVGLHTKMNLRAVKGNEAVRAAVPVAYAKAKPAVVGQRREQVTNREDGRYSRIHECNLPCRARLALWLGSSAGGP
jgi:hypothetical protein